VVRLFGGGLRWPEVGFWMEGGWCGNHLRNGGKKGDMDARTLLCQVRMFLVMFLTIVNGVVNVKHANKKTKEKIDIFVIEI